MFVPHLISLDPGLRGCGIAYWDEKGVLKDVQYLRNVEKVVRGPRAWKGMVEAYRTKGLPPATVHFISEVPQVYVRGTSKGDPDDLLELAGVVGALVSHLDIQDAMMGVKPREWKGSVPKGVHHQRMTKALSPEDLALIEASAPPSLQHNTLDAVGIGRWFFDQRF